MLILVKFSRTLSSLQGRPVQNISSRILSFYYGVNVNFSVRVTFFTYVLGQNGLRKSKSTDRLSGYMYISRSEYNTHKIAEKIPAYDVSGLHALKPPRGPPIRMLVGKEMN